MLSLGLYVILSLEDYKMKVRPCVKSSMFAHRCNGRIVREITVNKPKTVVYLANLNWKQALLEAYAVLKGEKVQIP
jgi:hypothetical protein